MNSGTFMINVDLIINCRNLRYERSVNWNQLNAWSVQGSNSGVIATRGRWKWKKWMLTKRDRVAIFHDITGPSVRHRSRIPPVGESPGMPLLDHVGNNGNMRQEAASSARRTPCVFGDGAEE